MKPSQLLLSALMIATLTAPALAVTPYFNARSNRLAPGVMWHKSYYDPSWGVPYARSCRAARTCRRSTRGA